MRNCPCGGCGDRRFLCHSSCREYQDWKTEYETMKDAIRGSNPTSDARIRECWRMLRYGKRGYNK